MRRSAIPAVPLLVLFPLASRAQRATSTSADSAEIVRLENQWTAGLVKRDSVLFDRLLAPRFIYTENEAMMSREEVLHGVVAGTDTATAARNEEMVVHQYSPTTAVVTGWLIVEGRGSDGAFTHRYRFTDTWLKGRRGWQIVAAQDYLAPK